MKVYSRIKRIFPDIVIKCLGSVCDTRRIDSSHEKMRMIMGLMKRYEIPFTPLGGATNRIAFMIQGYTIKVALDRQGYKDNLMEYALSPELQPLVTKTYETNGYLLVAECVKPMSEDDFIVRKMDMLRILDMMSQDYLLGDVGYIKKNFTNWGIRDNGDCVILDYAYCHRSTEDLFTCKVCGDGILRYDSTFSYLKCNNATVCTAKYNYTQIKLVQGDEVDESLIQAAKDDSLVLMNGNTFVEVEENSDGSLVDSNVITITNNEEYQKFKREAMKDMDMRMIARLNLELMYAESDAERASLQAQIDELFAESEKERDGKRVIIDIPDVICIEDNIDIETMEDPDDDDDDGYVYDPIAAAIAIMEPDEPEEPKEEPDNPVKKIDLDNTSMVNLEIGEEIASDENVPKNGIYINGVKI